MLNALKLHHIIKRHLYMKVITVYVAVLVLILSPMFLYALVLGRTLAALCTSSHLDKPTQLSLINTLKRSVK